MFLKLIYQSYVFHGYLNLFERVGEMVQVVKGFPLQELESEFKHQRTQKARPRSMCLCIAALLLRDGR